MTRKSPDYIPLPKAGIAFRPEYLDFNRGIRVGNLDDNERITRLLKIGLEDRFQQPFVTERWGRGVFWQWIGFLARANRTAKPLSSRVSFGCSKYFVMVDTDEKLFKCGMQVERGYLQGQQELPGCLLASDWDWNRLVRSLGRSGRMQDELSRLVLEEGFHVFAGSWHAGAISFSPGKRPEAAKLRQALNSAPADHWAGFQIYYPMRPREIQNSSGMDLIESMLAIFDEVTPAMNLCMQIHLQPA